MKKIAASIFGSPYFLPTLIFAGKYAVVLQCIAALVFCGISQFGGPLGSLECAQILLESALTSFAIVACIELIPWMYRFVQWKNKKDS